MRFLGLALSASAVLGASFNFPHFKGINSCSRGLEAVPKTVAALVDDYAQLIGNYTEELGESFLADGFTDTSDSINALAGIPLGSVTFDSKEAFMANQETQAKIPLVVSSDGTVVTRDSVVVRWTQTFGAANQPVAGISILKFVCEAGDWKLKTLFTEFNSLVYFQNIGGSCAFGGA